MSHLSQQARLGAQAPAMFDPARFAPQYPPDLGLEPLHLDIELWLDLAERVAQGAVTTLVQANRQGVQELTLDAVGLAVAAVEDGDGRALTWRADGEKLYVRWPQPFVKGQQARVRVSYSVTSPTSGLYFSRPTAEAPEAPWYAVTDHETERARHWLPCIDLPNVRTALDIRLRANSRFTILANGYHVADTDHGDGTKTTHYRLEQRCPSYLICFAVGEFVRYDDGEFDDGEKTIPVAYFCSPQHTPEDLQNSFGRTKQMLAWMTRKFAAPFPFPKYYQWAAPGVSGAMENISLVSWTERMVIDAQLATEWTYLLDAVNVHEMSHSYFGDAVVCRDFAHAWLKESWATYIEQVWREDEFSAEEGQYVYYDNARAYMIEADGRYKRAIVNRHFRSSWDMYDRHLYPGGACRLHMLRRELGEEVFWTAVQDYLKRFNGKVVETDDFRLVMEEHSGRTLGHFFDQWFYTPGYPQIKVTFRYDADKQQGVFEIEQTQVDAEAGIPAFSFQTSVGWVVDGETHVQPLRIDQARQVCVVPLNKMPEQVRFDPRCEVLHKLDFNPGDDLLRRQLTDAPDVLGRIHAADELAKTGRYANVDAIAAAYRQEPFWGVRCEMARLLGEANTEAALSAIVGLLDFEQDPMVLPDLLAAAGQYRDPRIAAAVQARLQSGLGYVASEQAYFALGAQREQAPLDMLLGAAGQPSFNGIVQGGALRGLAASRRPEVLDTLLAQAGSGATSLYVRPTAVAALAEFGRGLERRARERVLETLIDLLRAPHYSVAMAATRGLGVLGAPEAIGALEGFARTRVTQEAAVAERVIESLRKQDKVDGSALQKQVETLGDRLRKLEDQVQRGI
ncbi:MAG: M1 family metallopeptidase [Caldilineaceae bacterium]